MGRAGMAVVKFRSWVDSIPPPEGKRVEEMIAAVLRDCRPPEELWEVTHHEARDSDGWELDFRLHDVVVTLRLEAQDSDVDNPGFRESIRYFLNTNWPRNA